MIIFVSECVFLLACVLVLQDFDPDAFDAFCVLVANTESNAGSERTYSSQRTHLKRIRSKKVSSNTECDAVSALNANETRYIQVILAIYTHTNVHTQKHTHTGELYKR